MLDDQTRQRLARQVNPVLASHGLEAAVDHLWEQYQQLQHPATFQESMDRVARAVAGTPDQINDLAGLAARDQAATTEPGQPALSIQERTQAKRILTLQSEVSSLRAEMADTLRRLEVAVVQAATAIADRDKARHRAAVSAHQVEDVLSEQRRLSREVATLAETVTARTDERDKYRAKAEEFRGRIIRAEQALDGYAPADMT